MATASPKTILIRLHDKALEELELAHQGWQERKLSEMRSNITQIQDILSFLHSNLDPNFEVSEKLGALYRYYLIQLGKLFIEPSEELFDSIRQFLQEWRETWWKAHQLTVEQ